MSSSLPSGKPGTPRSYDYGLGPYDGQGESGEELAPVSSLPSPGEPDKGPYDFYASGLPDDSNTLSGRADYYDRLYVGLSDENLEIDETGLYGERIINLSDNHIPIDNDAGVLSSVIESLFEADPGCDDAEIQATASDLKCAIRLMRRS